MIQAERYKIRHHRTPWVLTALGALATLAPATYLAFRAPDDPALYLDAFIGGYALYGLLSAAILGGWALGHEYRQNTLKRVVAVDARRARLLGAKAAAGAVALFAMLATTLAAGLGSAWLAATVNDDELVSGQLSLATTMPAMPVAAFIAFCLSAVFRSDMYATLAALAVMAIFPGLLAQLPTIGDFTPAVLTDQLSERFASPDATMNHSVAITAAAAATWIATLTLGASALFTRRDI
jgi:ABC-type transport system involved in multi-copper enzyme maturation permease subunit